MLRKLCVILSVFIFLALPQARASFPYAGYVCQALFQKALKQTDAALTCLEQNGWTTPCIIKAMAACDTFDQLKNLECDAHAEIFQLPDAMCGVVTDFGPNLGSELERDLKQILEMQEK